MRHRERARQALYWTAVSLLVCERLPFNEAARRMGLDDDTLKDILHRHRQRRLDVRQRGSPEPFERSQANERIHH